MRVAGKYLTVLFLPKNNKQQCLPLIHGLQLTIHLKLRVAKLSLEQMPDLFVLQINYQNGSFFKHFESNVL